MFKSNHRRWAKNGPFIVYSSASMNFKMLLFNYFALYRLELEIRASNLFVQFQQNNDKKQVRRTSIDFRIIFNIRFDISHREKKPQRQICVEEI